MSVFWDDTRYRYIDEVLKERKNEWVSEWVSVTKRDCMRWVCIGRPMIRKEKCNNLPCSAQGPILDCRRWKRGGKGQLVIGVQSDVWEHIQEFMDFTSIICMFYTNGVMSLLSEMYICKHMLTLKQLCNHSINKTMYMY